MPHEHSTQGDTAILLYFETGFYSTVHADFKLAGILLPQPSQWQADRHMPLPHFLSVFLFLSHRGHWLFSPWDAGSTCVSGYCSRWSLSTETLFFPFWLDVGSGP